METLSSASKMVLSGCRNLVDFHVGICLLPFVCYLSDLVYLSLKCFIYSSLLCFFLISFSVGIIPLSPPPPLIFFSDTLHSGLCNLIWRLLCNWGKNQTRSLTDLVSIVDEFVCQFLGGWLIGMTSGRLVGDTWKGLASNAVKPTMDIRKGLASITVKPTMKIKTRGVCCGAYNKNLMNTKYNYRATIMKRKRINKYKHKFWQNNQILATGDAHEEGATKSLAVRLA